MLTVRKLRIEGKNPIGTADLEWIFACNCEGTEQLGVDNKKAIENDMRKVLYSFSVVLFADS